MELSGKLVFLLPKKKVLTFSSALVRKQDPPTDHYREGGGRKKTFIFLKLEDSFFKIGQTLKKEEEGGKERKLFFRMRKQEPWRGGEKAREGEKQLS